ncbi:MAG: holo-ACP synthase [Chitinophagales bacterium]
MRVGVDLVDIARLGRILERRPSFASRVFTEGELSLAEDMGLAKRREFLAGRFAAKEAVLKGLGTGLAAGIAWRDIEVLRGPGGAPLPRLSGRAAEVAAALGVTQTRLSLSHDREKAVAVAIMEEISHH